MKVMRKGLPFLVLVVAVSLYFLLQSITATKSVRENKAMVHSAAVRASDTSEENERLNFGREEEAEFSKPLRDLFSRLYPPPSAPVKLKKPPKVKAPPPKVVVAAPPVVVKPVAPPPKIDRMPTFQVLGFLEKDDQLTVFVSLADEIYLVKNEQQFAGRYRVEALDRKLITITRNDGTGRVSIPLKEVSTPPKRSVGAAPSRIQPGNQPPLGGGN